jgi:hypothetical protein
MAELKELQSVLHVRSLESVYSCGETLSEEQRAECAFSFAEQDAIALSSKTGDYALIPNEYYTAGTFTPPQLLWATQENKFNPENFYRKSCTWRQRLYTLTAAWKRFLEQGKYQVDNLPSGVTLNEIIDLFRVSLNKSESSTTRKKGNMNDWIPSGWLLFHMSGPVAPHFGCQVAVFLTQESMVKSALPVIKEEKKVARTKKQRPANAEIIDLERNESYLNFKECHLEAEADVHAAKMKELNDEYDADRQNIQEKYASMIDEFSPSPKKRSFPSTQETTIDLVDYPSEQAEYSPPPKKKASFASFGFVVKTEPK